MPTLLPIHIAAGGLAIVLGSIALAVRKGGPLHRRIGLAFVYAMLAMGFSGSIMAFMRSPGDMNVTAGLMTAYFTITALTAVRPVTTKLKWLTIGAMTLAIVLSVRMMIGGVIAFRQPNGFLNGVPYFMLFFLGTVLALSAFGDMRVLRVGSLHGRQRLARHLWRMCFALFIASGSFFSIRARVAVILPDVINVLPLRMGMLLMPFGAMFYWLWRIRSKRPIPIRQ